MGTWAMSFFQAVIQSYSWCTHRSPKYETSSSWDPMKRSIADEYSSWNHVQRLACSALRLSSSWRQLATSCDSHIPSLTEGSANQGGTTPSGKSAISPQESSHIS